MYYVLCFVKDGIIGEAKYRIAHPFKLGTTDFIANLLFRQIVIATIYLNH